MQLVLTYTTTDGYTWTCDHVIPFNYPSKDQFLFDLEIAYDEYVTKHAEHGKVRDSLIAKAFAGDGAYPQWPTSKITFNGVKEPLDITDFDEDGEFYAPEVYTLEEWFLSNVGDSTPITTSPTTREDKT